MPATDALFFIDANKYLDLYRQPTVKELLATLDAHSSYLFVSRLCADEVEHNKLQVAATFLKQQTEHMKARYMLVTQEDIHEDVLKKLDEAQQRLPKLRTCGVPDQFGGEIEAVRQGMKASSEDIKRINQEVERLYSGFIDKISRSEDEVSRVLARIFADAVAHTSEQLRLARDLAAVPPSGWAGAAEARRTVSPRQPAQSADWPASGLKVRMDIPPDVSR